MNNDEAQRSESAKIYITENRFFHHVTSISTTIHSCCWWPAKYFSINQLDSSTSLQHDNSTARQLDHSTSICGSARNRPRWTFLDHYTCKNDLKVIHNVLNIVTPYDLDPYIIFTFHGRECIWFDRKWGIQSWRQWHLNGYILAFWGFRSFFEGFDFWIHPLSSLTLWISSISPSNWSGFRRLMSKYADRLSILDPNTFVPKTRRIAIVTWVFGGNSDSGICLFTVRMDMIKLDYTTWLLLLETSHNCVWRMS